MSFNISSPGNSSGNGWKFQWSSGFSAEWSGNFNRAQLFVDSECIRRMIPFTPMRSGVLYKSAVVGSSGGQIKQTAPYARYQYYGKVMTDENGRTYVGYGEKKSVVTARPLNYSKHEHPEAGPLWFERMKAKYRDQILEGAKKIAGGGTV